MLEHQPGLVECEYSRQLFWGLWKHVLTLIAKSRTYTNRTAKSMVHVFTPSDAGLAPKIPKKPPMSSFAQDSIMRDTIVAAAPPTMNGLRFPHRRRQLSLLRPTYGWTRTPESGPAIQTRASIALLIPRDSRYGYTCTLVMLRNDRLCMTVHRRG